MTASKPNWRETIECLIEDAWSYNSSANRLWLKVLKNLYSHPAYAGVVFYRLGRWARSARPALIAHLLYFLYNIFYPLVRMLSGLELRARTQIGPGLSVLHFGPTVIHPDTIAGENIIILPGVIIGSTESGTPCLGNNIKIGAGAIIIGSIIIGNFVNIGAGAVVTRNIPDHTTAVGIPAVPV